MGFGHFDNANLAVTGYAKVAADGTLLAASNLEFLAPHSPGGQYVLGSTFNIDGTRKAIFSPETITLITGYGGSPLVLPVVTDGGPYAVVITFSPLYVPGPPLDKDFSIIVLQPLIMEPTP